MTSPRNRIVLPAIINKQKVNKTSASRCSNQRRTRIIYKHRFNGGLASFMSERQQSPYDSTARSWLALVERRQRNFIELCNTGRWRHYYTHAQFLDETRKVLHLTHPMGAAGRLAVSEQIEFQQNIKQNDRHNQDAGARKAKPLSHSAFGQQRRPASAILAAVAGRL